MLSCVHWHTLDTEFLDAQSRVIDLGANIGQFSHAISQLVGCGVVAVEPNLELHALIPSHERIRKVHLAIGLEEGMVQFNVSGNSTASSVRAGVPDVRRQDMVPCRTLESFVASLGWTGIDLLKCDIEGGEIEMFDSCSDAFLQRIGQITVEFHDFCNLTPVHEVQRTLRRFRNLGFFSVRMSRVGHQDTWLINRRLHPTTWFRYMEARYVKRYAWGLRRVLDRVRRGPVDA